jgi:radical SAM protein with 4Fe4S-binding SPASM domain
MNRMTPILTTAFHKLKKIVRYGMPMPHSVCGLPPVKPLIANFSHRIPLTIELPFPLQTAESQELAVRLRWIAEDGTLFYGGQNPILSGQSTQHAYSQKVIIPAKTPTQSGIYRMEVSLVRGRRVNVLTLTDCVWKIEPLDQSHGQVNYGEFMIGLDVSMNCNLECIFCLRGFMDHVHFKDMEPGELLHILNQAYDSCSGISLSLGAEPTMNKQFAAFVVQMDEFPYMHTTMTTNGTTLSRRLSALLVSNKFKEIHVSLDGATKETVESIRKRIRFDRVIQNLQQLKEIKEKHRSLYPSLKMHFALMKRNIHELPDFVELAHELGAASIRFQHFIIPHESLIDESLWFDPRRANAFLQTAIQRCKEYGIHVDAPPLFELDKPPQRAKQLRTQQCHWPWKGMLIDPDGNATPCCQWKGKPFGNVQKEGFEAVWNGEAYRQLRQDWITGELNEHCRNCSALMEGDVNDFSSFIAAEYEQINATPPPTPSREAE